MLLSLMTLALAQRDSFGYLENTQILVAWGACGRDGGRPGNLQSFPVLLNFLSFSQFQSRNEVDDKGL